MTDLDTWQSGNDEYLAAGVNWVRLRLERQRGPLEARPASEGRWFQRKTPAQETPYDSELKETKELKESAARMAEAETIDPPPALLILGQRLGLSQFEREVLLLCAAVELDTRIAGLCAQGQGDLSRPHPTFALAMALFDDPAWDALSPERPLRRWRLIEINQPGAQPLTTSPLRADERIVNYLKGLNYLDDRLTPLLIPFDVAIDGRNGNNKPTVLPPSQDTVATSIAQTLSRPAGDNKPPVIQLVGPDTVSKQLIAGRAAAHLGLTLFRLPAESLSGQIGEVETLARLWERESALLPIALYLDAQEVDERLEAEKGGEASPLRRFLSRSQGIFLLATREVWLGLGPATTILDVDKPTPA